MVGASSRLLFLLINPISILHRRPLAVFHLARRYSFAYPLSTLSTAPKHLLHLSRTKSLIPIKFSQSFYYRATHNALQEHHHIIANDYQVSPSHPWPEWSRLHESLSISGYFNGSSNIEDEFVTNENLSMDFVAAANSCLAFARDRPDILGWLPRKDIEVLINDGYPFLFKSAHETERKMKSFLQVEGSKEARSVDLMKYILSYASNPIIYPERNINLATESSVRSLLQEMANLSSRGQSTWRNDQMPRNLGPNITMKRGDWICPKCSFMNFAKNAKCLECEELRPDRQLTHGEWDCPRCHFFNYGKNTVCLKCKCRRPDEVSRTPVTMGSKIQYNNDKEEKEERWFKKIKELHDVTTPKTDVPHVDNKNQDRPFSPTQKQVSSSSFVPFVPFPPDYFAKKDEQQRKPKSSNEVSRTPETLNSLEGSIVTESDPLDMSEEAKAERWFRRVAQIKDISELSQIPDEDFPSIMPMRKGVNRFVVSKRKTPLERRLTSPQYRKNLRIMSSEVRKNEGNDDD